MENIHCLNNLIQQTSELAQTLNIVKIFEDLNGELDEYEKENSKLLEQLQEKTHSITELNTKLKQKSEDLANMTKVSVMQSLSKQLNEKNSYIQILESQLEKLKNTNQALNNLNNIPNSPKYKVETPYLNATNESTKQTSIVNSNDANSNSNSNTNNELVQDTKPKKKKKEKDTIKNEPELVEQISVKEIPVEQTPTEQLEPEEPKQNKNKKKKESIIEHIDSFDPDNFEDINGYELIVYKKKYYLRDLETNELYDIVNNQPNIVVGLISTNGKVKFN
jgi:hypothetical protein